MIRVVGNLCNPSIKEGSYLRGRELSPEASIEYYFGKKGVCADGTLPCSHCRKRKTLSARERATGKNFVENRVRTICRGRTACPAERGGSSGGERLTRRRACSPEGEPRLP